MSVYLQKEKKKQSFPLTFNETCLVKEEKYWKLIGEEYNGKSNGAEPISHSRVIAIEISGNRGRFIDQQSRHYVWSFANNPCAVTSIVIQIPQTPFPIDLRKPNPPTGPTIR